jgi:hypothetical protein
VGGRRTERVGSFWPDCRLFALVMPGVGALISTLSPPPAAAVDYRELALHHFCHVANSKDAHYEAFIPRAPAALQV